MSEEFNKLYAEHVTLSIRKRVDEFMDEARKLLKKIESAKTVAEIMSLKKKLMLLYTKKIPLGIDNSYYCVKKRLELSTCGECEYGRLKGVCRASDSYYAELITALTDFREVISKYHDESIEYETPLDENMKKIVISELYKKLNSFKKHIALNIQNMDECRDIDSFMKEKESLLMDWVLSIPLGTNVCYFCAYNSDGFLQYKPDKVQIKCDKCEYGKIYGKCTTYMELLSEEDEKPVYSLIVEKQDELLGMLSEYAPIIEKLRVNIKEDDEVATEFMESLFDEVYEE